MPTGPCVKLKFALSSTWQHFFTTFPEGHIMVRFGRPGVRVVSGSGKIACKLWLPCSPVTHWWPELPANYGTRRQLEQYVQVVGHLSALVSFHVRSTVWSRRGKATGLPEFKKLPLHIGDGMNFLLQIAKMWAIPCTHCAMKLDFPFWQLGAYSPRESHHRLRLDRRQNLLKIDLSLWKIVTDIVIIVCQS